MRPHRLLFMTGLLMLGLVVIGAFGKPIAGLETMNRIFLIAGSFGAGVLFALGVVGMEHRK